MSLKSSTDPMEMKRLNNHEVDDEDDVPLITDGADEIDDLNHKNN